jgi:hypothetical protein
MAHYAFLDENNTVVAVITGKDESEGTLDWEKHYGDIKGLCCLRTSYNTRGGQHLLGGTPFRKNYAGIGYTYDSSRDAFIPPKPYDSWSLNEDTCLWDPPIPMPLDGKFYAWDEDNASWIPSDYTPSE